MCGRFGVDGVLPDAAVVHGLGGGGDARDVAVLQVEAPATAKQW